MEKYYIEYCNNEECAYRGLGGSTCLQTYEVESDSIEDAVKSFYINELGWDLEDIQDCFGNGESILEYEQGKDITGGEMFITKITTKDRFIWQTDIYDEVLADLGYYEDDEYEDEEE